ncbi:MAG TPA: DUF1896 family protein [Pedobacter sp.]|jgi:hypothetical protein
MKAILIEKLKSYIMQNNPDLLISLQNGFSLREYLEDKVQSVEPFITLLLDQHKPQYVIEELCMNQLTQDLRPSKYNYLLKALEEDFLSAYTYFKKNGVLAYEILNLIEAAQPTFQNYNFNEDNEDDRMLRYEITGIIKAYLSR